MEEIKTSLVLKKGREKPVLNRHPWIFSGSIAKVNGRPEPGDVVAVIDGNGRFLARAYYNPHSQIQGRILTWDADEAINDQFWLARIERTLALRGSLALEPETTAYRLINAESDFLPGLIVDKYGDFLVIQCLTLGIDRRKELLLRLLADTLHPAGIFERSDTSSRRLEGLEPFKGQVWGRELPDELIVLENNHKFNVDLMAGQKTGLYLDQRHNRSLVCQPHFVADKEILNVFAYTGGFAVYAASQEARLVINVDSSIDALHQAEENLALNELKREKDEYIAGNAFEILRYYRDEGRQFDVIILDPPKFAQSRRDLDRAARGYKDLNWLALRLLRTGGLLATFSCSGRLSADLFQKIVFGSAVDAGRDVQILQKLGQGPDHPILLTFPESAYLKGLLCRVW